MIAEVVIPHECMWHLHPVIPPGGMQRTRTVIPRERSECRELLSVAGGQPRGTYSGSRHSHRPRRCSSCRMTTRRQSTAVHDLWLGARLAHAGTATAGLTRRRGELQLRYYRRGRRGSRRELHGPSRMEHVSVRRGVVLEVSDSGSTSPGTLPALAAIRRSQEEPSDETSAAPPLTTPSHASESHPGATSFSPAPIPSVFLCALCGNHAVAVLRASA